MAYNIGLKALRSLCSEQSVLKYNRAKLSQKLFKGQEVEVFKWVNDHVNKFHVLPKLKTLEAQFPEVKECDTPEPSQYYLSLLTNQYFYNVINAANMDSQEILKQNKDNWQDAITRLREASNVITEQTYSTKLIDVVVEAPKLIMEEYHKSIEVTVSSDFGWWYMDKSGVVMPGDVVSFVGRPATGKTWQMLYSAIHNWRNGKNVLFVSMEMSILPITQRVVAMYAGTNIGQLKSGGYADKTYGKLKEGLMALSQEQSKLYVVDGNLAASAEDIFTLADQLSCPVVFIDGAYLMRHKNTKLDRFTRAAENVELMKRACTDFGQMCFGSWQFNRGAVKDKNKSKGEKGTLEDIGYTDAIGQISSIVLGLFQEEGVETMEKRRIRVLKGRNGETGEFDVHWDFANMDFSGLDKKPVVVGQEYYEEEPLPEEPEKLDFL